jgi:hypothetical protein
LRLEIVLIYCCELFVFVTTEPKLEPIREAGRDEIGDSRRLGPVTTVIEMSVEARGTDDGVEGIDRTLLYVLKYGFEDTADFTFAAMKEARGMGVTIDRGAVGDLVGFRDGGGTGPADEITFDGVAVGMSADHAAPGVTGEVGWKVGCDHVVRDVSFYEVGAFRKFVPAGGLRLIRR